MSYTWAKLKEQWLGALMFAAVAALLFAYRCKCDEMQMARLEVSVEHVERRIDWLSASLGTVDAKLDRLLMGGGR